MDDKNKNLDGANSEAVVVENVQLTEKDTQIKKLESDLQNYKNVALKRLGKLEGDADFVAGADKSTGLTVEETIKKALLEDEYGRRTSEKDQLVKSLQTKVSELTLALKNRPETSIDGGNNTAPVDTKDPDFTPDQLKELEHRAAIVKADPVKFIEQARKNLANQRR